MGSGTWTTSSFNNYISTSRGINADVYCKTNYSTQEIFKARKLDEMLNPYNIVRKCSDCEEHPNTLPVILGIDVTGSMGGAARAVAQKLNEIMTAIYSDKDAHDVEFCIMGIGDIEYDDAPIQISQFESDIRIAEQLDKIYFEGRGGGNMSESYSAAWYMGLNRCDLDCWKRGQKGIIITLGDELPNVHLSTRFFNFVGGQASDIDTKELLAKAKEKFNIFHISVDDPETSFKRYETRYNLSECWKELLGGQNYFVSTVENLGKIIPEIIKNNNNYQTINAQPIVNEEGQISW